MTGSPAGYGLGLRAFGETCVSTRTPKPSSGVCQVFAAVELSCEEIVGLRMCASFVVLATMSGQERATEFTSRRIRDAVDLEDPRWRSMLKLSLLVAEIKFALG